MLRCLRADDNLKQALPSEPNHVITTRRSQSHSFLIADARDADNEQQNGDSFLQIDRLTQEQTAIQQGKI